MKLLFISLIIISSFAALAESNILKVKKLVTPYISGSDISVSVSKKSGGFCGSEGAYYLAKVSVQKLERTMDHDERVSLKPVPKLIKTYAITESELNSGVKTLMAFEACLE